MRERGQFVLSREDRPCEGGARERNAPRIDEPGMRVGRSPTPLMGPGADKRPREPPSLIPFSLFFASFAALRCFVSLARR